ncbi:transient receptor potential cation channel subfamily A member, putative [Schistosoma mansoni]|uniref:transient receptor potential cation channel subfamily A member, putative n=1 Tax=Schistosoma mansoni TaxID=6183 RepID=UPI00022C8720|nr:transient receptor potential cation channel subfamily A member, putative [Schistosoma mansoni]|eukprot:XP_018647368.1 transient receptor potential cation channel subfamily A member, putative [Schistosoma mansoni]
MKGYLDCASVLVAHKARINEPDQNGNLPIHLAVKEGHLLVVRYLLSVNADPTKPNKNGLLPIHIACEKNYYSILKALLESDNVSVNAEGERGASPLHYCCIHDSVELKYDIKKKSVDFNQFNYYLNQQNNDKENNLINLTDCEGETPLHAAVTSGNSDMVKFCLEHNAFILAKQNDDSTPVHYACMKGDLECVQLMFESDPSIKSIVFIMPDKNGYTPLHLAAVYNHEKLVTYLVEQEELFKRLVNEKDKYGTTPLHYSTKMGNLGATIAFVLRGASALERDNERNTSLHTAAYYGRLHTCEKLLATPHGIRAMNCPDAIGRLPLHVAVEHGHIEIVKMFLDRGCLFRKCHLGNTPLHYVSIGGCIKICKLLLQSSPSLLNQTNFHGMTALHYAAKENNAEVLDYLLTSKAKILPDNDGIYFVTYALQRRNYETMKAIVTHSRWLELHEMLDNTSQCPVDGFIRNMPSMCKLVLDQCIKEIGTKNTLDHEIFYDFSILQRPMNPSEKTPQDPMKRIKLMVELKREELLIHPLCKAYLERKWQTYGRWVQLCVSVYYAVLLLAITCLVLGHSPIHHIENIDNMSNCSELKYEYFKDWNNYLEFLLNALAMSYSALTLKNQLNYNYIELGVIVMFLAWFNFLLQMMR